MALMLMARSCADDAPRLDAVTTTSSIEDAPVSWAYVAFASNRHGVSNIASVLKFLAREQSRRLPLTDIMNSPSRIVLAEIDDSLHIAKPTGFF
jgi:hypothetical protein